MGLQIKMFPYVITNLKIIICNDLETSERLVILECIFAHLFF